MKLIEPKTELYPQENYTLEGIYKQIEKCARISYRSEDKITDTSSKAFVDNLIKANHHSPLEHGTVYLYLEVNPENVFSKFEYPLAHFTAGHNWSDVVGSIAARYRTNQYSKVNHIVETSKTESGSTRVIQKYFITSNYRVIIKNNWQDDLQFLCAPTEHHIKRYCVKFTTNIGVTRESNRHRSFSTTEMSTRYCNFSKNKFDNQLNIVPSKWIPVNCNEIQALRDSRTQMLMYANMIGNLDLEDNMGAIDFWLFSLCTADYCYNKLIEKGWKPQQARVVLPLETYTDVVYTAFEDDWKHFFRLRTSIFAETGAPHPDMAKLADELYYKFKEYYGVEL